MRLQSTLDIAIAIPVTATAHRPTSSIPMLLHPVNARELAAIAEEAGTVVIDGAGRCPSSTGGWQFHKQQIRHRHANRRNLNWRTTVARAMLLSGT